MEAQTIHAQSLKEVLVGILKQDGLDETVTNFTGFINPRTGQWTAVIGVVTEEEKGGKK